MKVKRSHCEVAPGTAADDPVVPVDDLPVDLPVPEPPGDGSVGDGRGDAGQVHWILVPAVLVVHGDGHVLECRTEFHLQTRRERQH